LSAGPSTAATLTADEISAALSKGASDPQTVYVKASGGTLTAAQLTPLRERLAGVDGVSAVAQPVLTADRSGARIDVALADAPYTEAAMNVVRGPVREAAHAVAPGGATAMVGGTGPRRPRHAADLPGRRRADPAHPGGDAQKRDRAALPAGRCGPRVRRHARR